MAPGGKGFLFVTARDPSGIGLLRPGSPPQRDWCGIRPRTVQRRLSSDGGWVSFNARPNSLCSGPSDGRQSQRRRLPQRLTGSSLLKTVMPRHGRLTETFSTSGLIVMVHRASGRSISTRQRNGLLARWCPSTTFAQRVVVAESPRRTDIAVARDKIVFNLGEHTGNVWMTDLPPDTR